MVGIVWAFELSLYVISWSFFLACVFHHLWVKQVGDNETSYTELINASQVTDQCSAISEQHQVLLCRIQPNTRKINYSIKRLQVIQCVWERHDATSWTDFSADHLYLRGSGSSSPTYCRCRQWGLPSLVRSSSWAAVYLLRVSLYNVKPWMFQNVFLLRRAQEASLYRPGINFLCMFNPLGAAVQFHFSSLHF